MGHYWVVFGVTVIVSLGVFEVRKITTMTSCLRADKLAMKLPSSLLWSAFTRIGLESTRGLSATRSVPVYCTGGEISEQDFMTCSRRYTIKTGW